MSSPIIGPLGFAVSVEDCNVTETRTDPSSTENNKQAQLQDTPKYQTKFKNCEIISPIFNRALANYNCKFSPPLPAISPYISGFGHPESSQKDTPRILATMGMLRLEPEFWNDQSSTPSLLPPVLKQCTSNRAQIEVGLHYGINNFVMPFSPKFVSQLHSWCQQLDRIFHEYSKENVYIHLLVPFDWCSYDTNIWEVWNQIEAFCDYNSRLKLAINLEEIRLQNKHKDEENLICERFFRHSVNRWRIKDISMVFINKDLFTDRRYNGSMLNYGPAPKKRKLKKFDMHSLKLTKSLRFALFRFLEIKNVKLIVHQSFEWEKLSKNWYPHLDLPIDAYLQNLQDNVVKLFSIKLANDAMLKYSFQYQDNLLEPMQPLVQNLPSSSYDVFMLDKVKYERYNEAIMQATERLIIKQVIPQSLHMMLIGPGKGPLLDIILKAMVNHRNQYKSLKFKLVVVEKNSHMMSLLEWKVHNEWSKFSSSIQLLNEDVRYYKPNEFLLYNERTPDSLLKDTSTRKVYWKFDLIVSELLGSFGCNELAPECLENVCSKYLSLSGIVIPESFSSWVVPVCSPRIYKTLKKGVQNQLASAAYNLQLANHPACYALDTNFERPYICAMLLENSRMLAAAPQQLWSFNFDTISKLESLKRETVVFESSTDNWDKRQNENYLVHGFAGFFHCILYSNITIDTLPRKITRAQSYSDFNALLNDAQHSTLFVFNVERSMKNFKKKNNVESWFPIFFPLQTPVTVKSPHSKIEFLMVRDSDKERVWYEWSARLFDSCEEICTCERTAINHGCCQLSWTSKLHNSYGKHYSMKLS